MDATTPHTRRRNSRWDREATLNTTNKPKVAQITERDVEIFKLLARYTYLPLDDIHAFVGGSLKGLAQHINILSRKPNLYLLRPAQQRETADANHRRLIYQLDAKAISYLQEHQLANVTRRYHRNFAHELMACRIMASFELGARANPHVRLITWSEILADQRTPEATRRAARPEQIPVWINVRGERRLLDIRADGSPFGLERTVDGKPSYLFFPGIEADCGTEPIHSADLERTSIYRKFLAYLAIEEQELYRSHFGFPNLFVPIITTTTVRMRSMMDALNRFTGGMGSKIFLFKTLPLSLDRTTSEAAMLNRWERVGFPALDLGE